MNEWQLSNSTKTTKSFTAVYVVSNYTRGATQFCGDGGGSAAAAQIQNRFPPTHSRVVQ